MGISVLVALAGTALVAFSMFLFGPTAPKLPVLGDGDPPGLILTALGIAWSMLGTFQVLRVGRSKLAKAGLMLLFLVTAAGGAGGMYWVVSMSKVPATVEFSDSTIPDFELTDQNGVKVSAASLRGKPLILVFARGVW